MALASIEDLEAIGSLPVETRADDAVRSRAVRLLDLASAVVIQYVRTPEATILTWTEEAQTALAAVVAEVAGRRLSSPAAPTVDQYGQAPVHMGIRLWPTDKSAIDEIPEATAARKSARPSSIGVTRSDSWLEVTGRVIADGIEV